MSWRAGVAIGSRILLESNTMEHVDGATSVMAATPNVILVDQEGEFLYDVWILLLLYVVVLRYMYYHSENARTNIAHMRVLESKMELPTKSDHVCHLSGSM